MNILRLQPAGAPSVALVIALCASAGAWAQAISQFPSLVITPPPPNVILTLDDSGSMNWGFIPDSVGAQDATAGFGASVYNGAYYNPNVFYPTPRDADGKLVPTGQNLPGSATSYYPRTSFTAAYYDGFHPGYTDSASGASTVNLCTSYQILKGMQYSYTTLGSLTVIPGSAANPTLSMSPVPTCPGGAYYYLYTYPAGGTAADGSACPALSATGTLSPAFPPPSDSCFTLMPVPNSTDSGTPDQQMRNFANWYSFYRTRHLSVVSSAALSMQIGGVQTLRVAWQALNTCADFSGSGCIGALTGTSYDNRISLFANNHLQQFYDWLFELPAANTTPTRLAWWRAGQYYSATNLQGNSPYGANPNPSLSAPPGTTPPPSSNAELLCANNFNITLTDGLWNTMGEPANAGFCGNGDCGDTDSSTITLPDGTTYPVAPFNNLYGDGSDGGDSAISGGGLADIAFYYWSNNLRPDLVGFYTPPYVPNPNAGTTATTELEGTLGPLWPYWNPQNDPATWPHMVNFTVGVGLTSFLSLPGIPWIDDGLNVAGNSLGNPLGDILNAQPYCWPANVTASASPPAPTLPATSTCVWPQVVTTTSSGGGYTGSYLGAGNVYDLWHAAINSRGDAFSATSPQDIITAMATIFQRILGSTLGESSASGSSTAVSVGTGTAPTQIYVANYDASDWHSIITALPVSPTTGALTLAPGTSGSSACAVSSATWCTTPTSIPPASVRANTVFTVASALPLGGLGVAGPPGINFSPSASPLAPPGSSSRLSSCAPSTTGTSPTGANSFISLYGSLFGTTANDQNMIVCYLLGDTSNEQQNGGLLRNRHVVTAPVAGEIVLGDIIDSPPVYSWQEDFNDALLSAAQGGASYASFMATKPARLPVLFVGANDGMLHAFDASSPPSTTGGNEVFAYVPHSVLANLGSAQTTTVGSPPTIAGLPSPSYSHVFSVDGPVTVADAYISPPGSPGANAWHTVLVGTTGGGAQGSGQGVYALDVTNPGAFTASNVLWDMDGSAGGSNDPTLGDTIGQAQIVLLNNNEWAAVFGNGYDSTYGCPVLYVVGLAAGEVLAKINVAGPIGSTAAAASSALCGNNGLGSPTTVDVNLDGSADYVYAGDLQGNLWKFDLTSSDPSAWTVAFTSGGGSFAPLFTATGSSPSGTVPQPIVAAPNVANSQSSFGSYLLYFVTGHMFAVGDATNTATQSLYAVLDAGAPVVGGRSALVQQNLVLQANGNVNVQTPYATVSPGGNGWFVDFNATGTFSGERALSQPFLGEGLVMVSTVVPAQQTCSDGCSASFVYALNQYNGDGGTGFLTTTSGGTNDALASTVGCIKGLTFLDHGAYLNWYAAGNGTGPTPAGTNSPPTSGSGPGNTGQSLLQAAGPAFMQGLGKVAAPGRISWHEVTQQ